MNEQIKMTMRRLRLKMVNASACYHSDHTVLSSCLSSRNKIEIHATLIVLILYGFKPWYVRLRKKKALRVYDNRMLRKIFVAKRKEVTGWKDGKNCILRSFMIFCNCQILLGRSNEGG